MVKRYSCLTSHQFWTAVRTRHFRNYIVVCDIPRYLKLSGFRRPTYRWTTRCGTSRTDGLARLLSPFSCSNDSLTCGFHWSLSIVTAITTGYYHSVARSWQSERCGALFFMEFALSQSQKRCLHMWLHDLSSNCLCTRMVDIPARIALTASRYVW